MTTAYAGLHGLFCCQPGISEGPSYRISQEPLERCQRDPLINLTLHNSQPLKNQSRNAGRKQMSPSDLAIHLDI